MIIEKKIKGKKTNDVISTQKKKKVSRRSTFDYSSPATTHNKSDFTSILLSASTWTPRLHLIYVLRKDKKESEKEEKTENSWTLFLPSTQQPIADIKQVDFCPSLRK